MNCDEEKNIMSEMKKCPECNAENPKAANFCRKCRYEFPEATKEGLSLKPEIKYFRIREEEYVVGSKIHLEWDVDNCTKVELAGEEVTLYKDVELVVEKAVELQLIALNDYDQTAKSIKVIPQSSPNIQRFHLSHSTIEAGEKTKLSWTVEHAKKILLKSDSNEIDVSSQSEIEVSPKVDTTYSLVAFAIDESVTVSKDVTLKVLRKVVINDFSSDIAYILESQPMELKWDVDNADKIMLYPNDIDITYQSSIKLYPNRAETYRLVASNAISQEEKVINIGVRPLPRFDVKLSDTLSRLQIPNCNVDLAKLTGSIRETNLDRWILTPMKQDVSKKIWQKSIWNKLWRLLEK